MPYYCNTWYDEGHMMVTLTGENDFARTGELKKRIDGFISQYGDFGIEHISAGDTEFGRLLETVSSMPFLAERRMVIVHDLNASKPLNEKIEQFLDSVSDTTDLILEERKLDKRLTLYKILKKRTEFYELSSLDERGLSAWLVKEAETRGGNIKPNDAAYLVQRVGANQMGLSNELDKLLGYDTNITRTTINLLTEPLPQSSVFDLLDSAFAGDKQKTMALYEDQRKQQVEPQAIMGMIAWQLHMLAVVKLNEADGAGAIAGAAKMSPYSVNKSLGLARKLTTSQVKDLVARALRLDVRLKSEAIDADDAVQHFLLNVET